jgi:hypothetical protein
MSDQSTKKSKKELYQSLKDQLMLAIVLAIIISLFIVSFFAFSLKIEDHNWNVLWNYFNTEVFKTLLLSIAIPLVVFIWRSYEKKETSNLK